MRNFIIVSVAVLTLSICSCCGGFNKGQKVSVTEECIWADNVVAYDKMMNCCIRRDSVGLAIMETNGEVGILKRGDKGVVTDIDKSMNKTKIRLEDGHTVWVATQFRIISSNFLVSAKNAVPIVSIVTVL